MATLFVVVFLQFIKYLKSDKNAKNNNIKKEL